MRNLFRLIGRFRSDRRGNIAVIFAIACVPLISAIGCAIDYSTATRMKAKLQAAADGAAIASLSQKSPGFVAAAAMAGNGSVDAGVADANNVFDGNMNQVTGYTNLSRTSTVTKTGVKLAANVTYSADVPVTFMKVVGKQNLTVSGSSSASASLPPYLDFYLLLDVSGSMGLPSTTDEAKRMQGINPDNWVQYRSGCTLACHFTPKKSACVDPPVTPPAAPAANPPTTTTSYTQQYNTNNACMGFAYSRVNQVALAALLTKASTSTVKKQVPGFPITMLSGLPGSLNTDPTFGLPAVTSCPTAGTDNCIQLRLDAVGYALNDPTSGMFALAQQKTVVTNQFRIGLYPFITDIDKNYAPLTSTIVGGAINTAAQNLAAELDTNTDATLGSGGTHIDTALSSINTLITSVGTGSSPTSTQPYVFLVTDGAQDNQYKDVPNGSWHGSNHATVIAGPNSKVNPGTSPCKALRDRGIIVSVLNIPYQTIDPVNTSFAGNEDTYANNNIPNIESSLQDCASPPDAAGSYYYKATSPDEIKASLNAMFNHSLQSAHLTH